jgi:acetyl esterase
MGEKTSREKAIRKGRRIQWISGKFKFIYTPSKFKKLRKELIIDTTEGKVRTLWYGLDAGKDVPLFIDLHGGGFILGNPEMDEEINVAIQQDVGCKVVSVDYTKAPNHPYPAAVNQVYAVVEYIVSHADDLGIDPNKMAIGGHSAGGNLATVTCIKAKEQQNFQIACQILDYPPLDIATSAYKKPQPKGCIPPDMAEMFNACYVEPEQAKEIYVSPIFAISDQLHGLPPALIIVAGQDLLHDEGLLYAELLSKAGVAVETYEYRNAAHGFTLKSSDDSKDAISKMIHFLKKYLS